MKVKKITAGEYRLTFERPFAEALVYEIEKFESRMWDAYRMTEHGRRVWLNDYRTKAKAMAACRHDAILETICN